MPQCFVRSVEAFFRQLPITHESESFCTVARTVQTHYQRIVNFLARRSTHAASESFNVITNGFRAQLKGDRDIAFYLFRLSEIYA